MPLHDNLWEVHCRQGAAFLEKKQYLPAIESFQKALTINPHQGSIYYEIGVAFQKLGLNEQADNCFKQCLQMSYNLGRHNLEAGFYENSKIEEAIKNFKVALKINSEICEIHYELGNALTMKKLVAEATASYKTAIRLKPNWIEPKIKLAELYLSAQLLEQAADLCEEIIDLAPEREDAYLIMGRIKNALGDNEKASAFYRKAFGILRKLRDADAYNYEILYKIADVKVKLGQEVRYKKKIAFLVFDMAAVSQYSKIWRHLRNKDFEIIVCKKSSSSDQYEKLNTKVQSYLAERQMKAVELATCLDECQGYEYLISWGGDPQIFPKHNGDFKISKKHIRYVLYGAAIWGGEWNDQYWMFLCQGPYQTQRISKKYAGKAHILATGYPRFDDYFTAEYDCVKIKKQFGCQENRPTILWYPDHNYFSSIIHYYEYIVKLSDRYNIILKPHQNCFFENPTAQIIRFLEKSGKVTICPPVEDESALFHIADFLLADYGGSALIGICLDINTLLLNASISPNYSQEGTIELEQALREEIVNISVEAGDNIDEILADDDIWEKQKEVRKLLRNQFFMPYQGFSGRIIAQVLKNLEYSSTQTTPDTKPSYQQMPHGVYQEGQKKNQILFISDTPDSRVAKFAYGLSQLNHEIVLLHKAEPIFNYSKYFSECHRYNHPQEALELAASFNPLAYHVFSSWNYDIAAALIRNKIGKIVFDDYDVMAGMVKQRYIPNSQLDLERFCLENADGLCCRSLETQYAKQNYGYSYAGKRIFILDCCWAEETLKRAPDAGSKHSEVHIVYCGNMTARMNEPYNYHYNAALLLSQQHIHYHIYPYYQRTAENLKSQMTAFVIENGGNPSYIHVHQPVPCDNLISELSAYHYGLHIMWPQNGDQERFPYHQRGFHYGSANKIFDYIDAGLSILIHQGALQKFLVTRYDNGKVVKNFSDIIVREIPKPPPIPSAYHIRPNMRRLLDFYYTI